MPVSRSRWVRALTFGSLVMGATAFILNHIVQAADAPSQPELRTGAKATGDWTTDAPGVRRKIVVEDLPAPYSTRPTASFPRVVARPAGAMPVVPAGFQIDMLAEGLSAPREIITAPNGDLFVAESYANRIRVVRQGEDGKITASEVFAGNLDQPFGMAFYPLGPDPKYLYVGNTGSVVRIPYTNGDLHATGAPEMIVPDIPSGGRLTGGGHWTRDVRFSQDGKKMYVSVGSHSNVSDDAQENRRADILEYNPDGTGFRIYASGIRNAVGIAIEPTTGVLWCSVNERDDLGDDVPPEYITHVEDGGFYGWPWYYIGNHQDPRHKGKHPELASKVIVPDVLIQTHSASLCMMFYTDKQFPAQYQGMAFAAEHGSWNRSRRTGYKIICVPMVNGKATGEYDDFVTGFVTPEGNVWGRPVGVTTDKQGSLIFSDDGGNRIWRVRYVGGAQ